jgi:hypothetical protein
MSTFELNATAEPNLCPVCQSTDIQRAKVYSAVEAEGEAYLSPALNYFGLNRRQFISESKEWRCTNCGCGWMSPWFSDDQAIKLFSFIKPNHQAGWDQFERIFKGKDHGYYLDWIRSILKDLCDKNELGLNRYGEVGCPFSGFALASVNFPSKVTAIDLLFKKKESGSLWHELDHSLRTISKFIFRLLTKKNRKKQAIRLAEKKIFINVTTKYGWGTSCVRFNKSCAGAALELSVFDTINSIETLTPNSNFDLIGVFNYLDHLENPLGTLRTIAMAARRVVVCVHSANTAGRQHKITFSLRFVDFIRQCFTGHEVSLLDTLVNGDEVTDFCFLMVRK